MNKYILTLLLLTFLLPSPAAAQLSTTTGDGISISSEFVEQVRNIDGEEVEHAPVSLQLGVRKRFSSSRADVADLEITPSIVLNEQLLELYVRKTVLVEPVTSLTVGEAEVVANVRGPAKLLGFIPVRMPYEVTVTFDTRLEEVTTRPAAWWSFLAQTQSTEETAAEIRTELEGVRYLSRIQLRAFILEAALAAVTI